MWVVGRQYASVEKSCARRTPKIRIKWVGTFKYQYAVQALYFNNPLKEPFKKPWFLLPWSHLSLMKFSALYHRERVLYSLGSKTRKGGFLLGQLSSKTWKWQQGLAFDKPVLVMGTIMIERTLWSNDRSNGLTWSIMIEYDRAIEWSTLIAP